MNTSSRDQIKVFPVRSMSALERLGIKREGSRSERHRTMSARLVLLLLFVTMASTASLSRVPAKHERMRSPARFVQVFIGTATAFVTRLGDPVMLGPVISSGEVGLYMHNTGMARLTSAERDRVITTWALTGIGRGRDLGLGEVSEFRSGIAADSEAAHFPNGRFPREVNINVSLNGTYRTDPRRGDASVGRVYPGYMSATDLAAIKRSVDLTARDGAENAAIFVTPNAETQDLDDPFASSGYWANVRTALLYAGGLAVDSPPTFWARVANPRYKAMIAQQIAWAKANNLRVSVVISPYPVGGSSTDLNFLQNTRMFVEALLRGNVLPTEWVVENYGNPANGSNDLADDPNGSDSLETVALFLSQNLRVALPATARPLFAGASAQNALMLRMIE